MKKTVSSKKVKSKYIGSTPIGTPQSPISVVLGAGNSGTMHLGPSHTSANSGDIKFTAGQDGDIIFGLADGTELLRFDSQGKVEVLGEPISFEKVKKLLKALHDPEPCNCSSQQLLNGGCVCDGA